MDRDNFWKQKLMAFLHDPPCKCLNIADHEETSKRFMRSAGFSEDEIANIWNKDKTSDHTASAIDRIAFPKRECSAKFTGHYGEKEEQRETFLHPFCGAPYEMPQLKPEGAYIELLQDGYGSIEGSPREQFFLYWRMWMKNAINPEKSYSAPLAYFPADTRIPDHSIWNHMALTSALEGCRVNGQIQPAFLIFQAGPVQDFIAQARSTRDLWSGSYLLAWLTGNAIKSITDECGPDSIIFPMLRGIGVYDVLNKDIYDNAFYKGRDGQKDSLWQRLYRDRNEQNAKILLNPSMPNRFCAILPSDSAENLAKKAEAAFRKAWTDISEDCWKRFSKFADKCPKPLGKGDWKKRWDDQVARLPEITWQIMPVERDLEQLRNKAGNIPSVGKSLEIMDTLVELATKRIDKEVRDERFYSDKDKTRLNNWGVSWAVNYGMCEYALSARRNTRNFEQYENPQDDQSPHKDSLSGKEDIIGSKDFWRVLSETDNDFFKKNEGNYGAISIIKRFWCRGDGNYLLKKLDIEKGIFNEILNAYSTEEVAKNNSNENNPYIAVIALDGDEMGKWMSGEKAQPLLKQLAGKAPGFYKSLGIDDSLLRPLTPSYHLQFSEALGNFANHLAGKIVSHYKGQLVYAGGDDVLAILPASEAIQCARMLRAVFRGDSKYFEKISDFEKAELAIQQDGFVQAGFAYPLLVPGTKADVSCGIAIAHKHYPLQRMVGEARRAESRAKNEYNRGAFAVSLLKRGGEIVHWGGKWDSAALELYFKYCELRKDDDNAPVSGRFPYALAGLLKAYKLDKDIKDNEFPVKDVILRELDNVLENQVAKGSREELRGLCVKYLDCLGNGYELVDKPIKAKWEDFVKLFFTAAFIERDRGE